MLTHKKLRADLKRQQEIEGYTPETGLLLKILPHVKTSMQWQQLTTCTQYRYGDYSYQTHRFWYPNDLLLYLTGGMEDE